MKRYLLLSGLFVFISSTLLAQAPVKPRPSPLEMVTMKYEDTYIKITYCRPHKRGREIFGDLVPYNQVWRTGANEATEITTTGKIQIGGQSLPAGTYSLFTIPKESQWTVIISSDVGQWGAFRYNEENDVLRFEANTLETEEIFEPFTIEFEQSGLKKTNILLIWDTTKVVIPIEFS